MARLVFAALASLFLSQHASAVNGQITNLDLAVKFGTAPGLDFFDASGNYVQGSGNNGISLPSEAVVLSFDNGKFIQALPSNSFTAISGGWRYTAPAGSSGITLFKIMNNGTFDIDVRKSDFTGSKSTAMGPFTITIGDDVFSVTPNSVPVGRINASSTITVGALATLDATTSSDFNSDSLTYTWSIVSQPLGANVNLSSANQPTTSFIPTLNGAYTLKVVPHDGISEGLPAVVTLQATGGEADPVPPPSHKNGLITLSSDQASYIVGEQATLNAHEDIQVGNGTNRYFFRATLDDAPITLTVVPGSNVDNIYATPVFSDASSHTFKVDLFIENTNMAKQLLATIDFLNSDIAAVNAALVNEQDPAVIASLNAQKAADLSQITEAQEQLELNRTHVGDTVQLQFNVN